MRLKTALKRLCKLLPMPQPLEEFMRNDDDYDDDKTPAIAGPATKRLARPRSATEALNQFAGEDGGEATPDAPASDEAEPEQPAQDTAPEVSSVLIETAYERGKEAKRTGMKRTAPPGEYREAGREREIEAWRKGWDGDAGGGGP
jgi:hypothetical protein